jgi:RHS repeat-associated protein
VLTFHHADVLGTPVAVTDRHGNVVERSEYEPYGVVRNRPIRDGPGYTGHVEDAQTGLVYMQQRLYDPETQRFLSVDPVAARPIGDNFNRYWYANNNPYKFIDPDGRETAMFQKDEYRMPQPDAAATRQALGVIADFTPIVGDVKGFYEAYQNPTGGNVAGAVIGVVPLVGDLGKIAVKQGDEAISMATAIDKGVAHVGADADVIMTKGGNVSIYKYVYRWRWKHDYKERSI